MLKSLAKDPAGRYASAQSLAEDLSRFLEFKPIRARRSTAWERSVKWAQRRPAIAALLAIVFLTIIVGFMGGTSQWVRAERARQGQSAVSETLKDPLFQQDRPGGARARRERPPPGGPATGRMPHRAERLGMELLEAVTERVHSDYLSCR